MAATAMVDTVVVMAAMAVATTARGLLMPSLRLMLLLRVSPDTMVATAVDMAAMVATGVAAMDTMARGRLRLSLATAMVATDTARDLLSPAMAMAATAGAMVAMVATATAGAMATGVSYHRRRRSELSQKQNHKNSQR